MATQKVRPDMGFNNRQQERQRRRSRNRKVGAFAVAASIAVVGLIAWATLRGGDPQVPAGSPSQTATGGAVTHYFVDLETGARTPLPTAISGSDFYPVSPDGTMFAYRTLGPPGDRVQVANIDGTNARTITPSNLDVYDARWSPDGSTLVFQGHDPGSSEIGQLYLVDVTTGKVTPVTDFRPFSPASGWWFLSPSFSPDGRTILFHLPRGSTPSETWDLWTVPVSGGEPTLLRRDAAFGVYAPDGTIAYLHAPEDFAARSIWLMDEDGSDPRRLVESILIGPPRWSPDGTRIAYEEFHFVGVFVVEVATGQTAKVDEGSTPEWFDDDTLIVD